MFALKKRIPAFYFLLMLVLLTPCPAHAVVKTPAAPPKPSVASKAKTGPKKARKKDTAAWDQRMRGLYVTLTRLLAEVSSDSQFNDPANFKRIEADAKLLSELVHDLSAITRDEKTATGERMLSPDTDPSILLMTSLFSEDTKRAYEALKTGHRDYARVVLRTVTGYCIGCHTRSTPAQATRPQEPETPEIKSLSQIERAEFLASTLQNDAALEEFEKIISDPKIRKERQLAWEKTVRYALAIAVRVKRDPARAIKIVDAVLGAGDAPEFLKEDAELWKASIAAWRAETARTLTSEDALYAETVRLITQARMLQKYPADHAADVLYLRVSATVHDLLRIAPNGRYSADALFLLGLSYEALRDMNLWSLHEMSYEACIRKSPHTETAKNCYSHYEETIYAGYSGSGGVSIPKVVAAKLDELEKLSIPQGTKVQ
ncbi:MAG: hypothetical protein HYW49_04775 [Deltaproteobacteria bacterium]|nr:hypothetical protein [Deltaproteobacteria bacterium]